MAGWQVGRLKVGRLAGWQVEGWQVGRLKVGRLAGWQVDGVPEVRNDIKYSWVS
ncbi:MAG: hypothetical protein F6K56_01635 [Moorea sp. SIO3G5]|nr:hypothetical protein [Moorena sp. SIO3G5]